MLRQGKDITSCRLEATDGDVGKVRDLFFEDDSWHLRYLVVDTGTWLHMREVLIAPDSVTGVDRANRVIYTKLTRKQIEQSPGVETDSPISRIYEQSLHDHYGWPYYWSATAFGGPGLYVYPPIGDLGLYPVPDAATEEGTPTAAREAHERRLAEADPHLRSYREVRGYAIGARDGEIGHVEDFLVDDSSWRLTHLIVDTRNWLPGRKVVVDTGMVTTIDWAEGEVAVRATRQQIKNSPPYIIDMLIDEKFQAQVSAYYRNLEPPRPQPPISPRDEPSHAST